MPLCSGVDIGCVSIIDNITGRESGLTSLYGALHERTCVRRLQVRIVQATKESRWGKVRALQRLLTHSYSGKVLAVQVTENNGKKTPGVDQEIWDTPEKKTQAVQSDSKTMRPLGIPTMKDHWTIASAQDRWLSSLTEDSSPGRVPLSKHRRLRHGGISIELGYAQSESTKKSRV
jgi:hypothetical protein